MSLDMDESDLMEHERETLRKEAQRKRNVDAIQSALAHISAIGIILKNVDVQKYLDDPDNDEGNLEVHMDSVIDEAKEVLHRVRCDDCRGDEGK